MNLETLLPLSIYVFAAAAVIFLVEALYVALTSTWGRRRGINRRMRALEEGLQGEQVLHELRRQRGVVDSGATGPIASLRRLITQSGLRLSLAHLLSIAAAIAIVLVVVLAAVARLHILWSTMLGLSIGFGSVWIFVRFMRSRRQNRFMTQLPDALDVVVRSLKSGHPVPVALAMVGRELADPIGTEFGFTVDEMTYGLDMEQAMKNMYERVGHQELTLLITAVSLQSTTGGNLGAILSNLSKVIRERFQLQRKVRALSAEGRVSAYGLSLLPIVVFLAVRFLAPSYYEDVYDEPVFIPTVIVVIIWSLIGNFIMYKMIKFKF